MSSVNIDRHVGNRIKARREYLGMTQMQLGDMVGASEVQMSRYEGGVTAVKPELMEKLAVALRVSVTYFLEEL